VACAPRIEAHIPLTGNAGQTAPAIGTWCHSGTACNAREPAYGFASGETTPLIPRWSNGTPEPGNFGGLGQTAQDVTTGA